MIQLNLLPDVKLQYLKVRRTQRLVISVSSLLIAASLVVFVLLIGTVDVFQKKNLNDLNHDISTYTSQLQNTPNLNKILTVQNQLQVLTNLHGQKPAASRLFSYLQQVTPSTASISQFNIDFTQNTVSITGNANSLDDVNAFTDTLKFTTYKQQSGSTANAFTAVVLSEFSRGSSGATYTITTSFDPNIFNGTNTTSLTVPNIISTRSVVEQPTDLFQSNPAASNSGGQ
jgi:Tfp pilus assembly protein PilN